MKKLKKKSGKILQLIINIFFSRENVTFSQTALFSFVILSKLENDLSLALYAIYVVKEHKIH